MLVLGIDPGLAITGYGLVSGDGRDYEAVAYGVIRTPARTPIPTRLLQLHDELNKLLDTYQPETAAVEELFFATNARTAIMVSEARGVTLLSLARASLSIAEYTPLQVKQSVTGFGKADKRQVQEMVRVLLGLQDIPRPDDAADALAVAICHHNATRMQQLLDQQDSTP